MKAIQMLAVTMIFALALLVAAFLGTDKRDIGVLAAMFGGMIPLLSVQQNRRGGSCCWFRKATVQAEA